MSWSLPAGRLFGTTSFDQAAFDHNDEDLIHLHLPGVLRRRRRRASTGPLDLRAETEIV